MSDSDSLDFNALLASAADVVDLSKFRVAKQESSWVVVVEGKIIFLASIEKDEEENEIHILLPVAISSEGRWVEINQSDENLNDIYVSFSEDYIGINLLDDEVEIVWEFNRADYFGDKVMLLDIVFAGTRNTLAISPLNVTIPAIKVPANRCKDARERWFQESKEVTEKFGPIQVTPIRNVALE